MKLFLVISLLLGLALGAPSDVEVVKQRLIRFPEDPNESQTKEQADETRRILEEINKINAALGYIKKHEGQERHGPTLLDSNTYLYPKPPSPPIEWKYHNGAELPGSIPHFEPQSHNQQYQLPHPYHSFHNVHSGHSTRNLQKQGPIARKIIHQHSVMIPDLYSSRGYYYPQPLFRAQIFDTPRTIKQNAPKKNSSGSNMVALSNDITSIVEYARGVETHDVDITAANNEEFEAKLLDSVHKIVSEARGKKSKGQGGSKSEKTSEKKQSTNIKFVAIPTQTQSPPGIIVTRRPVVTAATGTPITSTEFQSLQLNSKSTTQNQLAGTSHTTSESHRLLHKQKPSHNQKVSQNQAIKLQQALTQAQSLDEGHTQNMTKAIPFKNPFTIFQRPLPSFFSRPSTNTPLPQPLQSIDNNDSDYEVDDPYSGNYQQSSDKGIFQQALDNQREVLKSGGVLIQKLRVRKGGIAIAGPGGVATAGSGGTAIVGPGGVALTHPRSLTIAGPGAKVVALPITYDLEKAIWETSARHYPSEGVVVATGPTIYYSP